MIIFRSLRLATIRTPYGIDFVELEEALPEVSRPAGAVSISDYEGAKPGDGVDDSDALVWAMDQAANTPSKTVLHPRGTWELGRQIGINHSDLTIQGAGMWYTDLRFTSDQVAGGGFTFNHEVGGVTITDFYMSSNLKSRYSQNAQYKGLFRLGGIEHPRGERVGGALRVRLLDGRLRGRQ